MLIVTLPNILSWSGNYIMNNMTFNDILYNIYIVNEQNYELYEKKLDHFLQRSTI